MATNQDKYYIHCILILFFSIFCTLNIYSAITIKRYSNIDGLSNNSINCIFQDSENKLWVGTWDGLNVFNGRNFFVYRYNNEKNSISNNIIRHIVESYNGDIWVATDFGINRWDRYSNQFEQYFINDSITSTKRENAFWVGTLPNKEIIAFVDNLGFFHFNNQTNKFEKITDFRHKTDIKKIIVNQDGQLFILFSNDKLEKYSIKSTRGKIQLQPISLENYSVSIKNIFSFQNFFVTYTRDYITISDNKNSYPSTINIDKNKTISQVLFYNENFLISYYEGGLDIYNTKTRQLTPVIDFSQSTSIFNMYLGNQDILWIGTDGQGLFQVYDYKAAFKSIKTNYPVRSFYEYSDDEILLGTKGEGILAYSKRNHLIRKFASTENGLISNSVYALAKNKDGDIFIGTEGEGINVIQGGRIYKLELPQNSPLFRSVYSITFSEDQSYIWLGTSSFGLIRIQLEKEGNNYKALNVKQYSTSNDVSTFNNNIIYSVVQGLKKNDLWVSTRRDGLFLFDVLTEKFTNFNLINTQSNISDNDILTLLKNQETLWVGTSYGLNEINLQNISNSKINTYTEKQGLANNTIHGILKNNNTVWISTNLGLSEINLDSKRITSYTIKDGLQNDEFSDGASYQDSDTIFYFGGVAGFNYFNPNDIKLRDFSPEIAISNLKIFNTPMNVNERIKANTLKLKSDEAYITLTFIAEDYINNENCEYKYRLVNFSDEWINNGQNPNIVLTNLLPGKHELQVNVTNGDRVWSNSIYTLNIYVAYPWWLSAPAIIVYFILLGLIFYVIYLFIRNKVRRNRKQLLDNIEKENQKKIHESKLDFFTNVAHEFFTPLTLIYGPAQHLLEKSDLDSYTKRYVLVIKNNADRMQKLINELMDFRKVESGNTPLFPEKIDVNLLIKYICDNYTEISEETKIRFNVEIHNLSIFTTDRNSIEKILFNLISNAFKYTPNKGYIHASLTQTQDELVFIIKNSGNGLTTKQMSEIFNKFKIFGETHLANSKSTGIGLSLVKGIVELLNGTITVDSKLNEYVEFELKIPSLQTKNEENILVENTDITNYSDQIIQQKDITILIVEDEKEIRELLVNILKPYYNVNDVTDGIEAIEAVSKNTPDVIISDVLMPNLDGMELIKKLKSNSLTSHIPIINISAKNSLEDKLSAYEYGADLYITKPFHPRHILVTIQNLIRKQSQLKEYFRSGISMVTMKDGIRLHQEDENILNDIISFVEKHLDDESLNPNSIADALGISKASLYRKMEELTQKTPSEFVRNIRLNHAGLLLKSTKMTVQEIMFKSGFSNKSYFYREFAKQFNTSPNEYRQDK